MIKRLANSSVLTQLILLAFIGGSLSPLLKLALASIPPLSLAFVRTLIVAIFVACLMATKIRLTFTKIKAFIGLGVFWWLSIVLYILGLQTTTATTGQFIHVSIPILTALFSLLLLGNKLRPIQWAGIFIAAGGVGSIILSGSSLSLSSKSLLGNLLILTSATIFALYATFSPTRRYQNLSSLEMVFIAAASGALATLPFAIRDTMSTNWLATTTPQASAAMIAVGLVSGLFYAIFQQLVKKVGPSYTTLTLYLIPLFTIFWAALLLHEHISSRTFAGGLIALFGVWLVTNFATKRPAITISE